MLEEPAVKSEKRSSQLPSASVTSMQSVPLRTAAEACASDGTQNTTLHFPSADGRKEMSAVSEETEMSRKSSPIGTVLVTSSFTTGLPSAAKSQ